MPRPNLVRSGAAWTAFAGALMLAPLVFADAHSRLTLILVMLYATLAVSWNLTLGLAGIFNFAQVAFFGVGAYTTAILCGKAGLPPWPAMALSAVSAALSAGVAFLPVLRLRGIYVGLATYVFSQLCIYVVLGQKPLTGGSDGIVGLPDLTLGVVNFYDHDRLGYYYLGAVLLFLAALVVWLVGRSRFGLSLLALRADETLAASRGINRTRQQLLAFVLGAAIAGLAGSYEAYFTSVVSTDVFGTGYLTILLSMIFLGGRRSIAGAIAGAVVIALVQDQLSQAGAMQQIVSSAIILAVLWFFPDGLAGLAGSCWHRLRDRRAADAPASVREPELSAPRPR